MEILDSQLPYFFPFLYSHQRHTQTLFSLTIRTCKLFGFIHLKKKKHKNLDAHDNKGTKAMIRHSHFEHVTRSNFIPIFIMFNFIHQMNFLNITLNLDIMLYYHEFSSSLYSSIVSHQSLLKFFRLVNILPNHLGFQRFDYIFVMKIKLSFLYNTQVCYLPIGEITQHY